MTGVSNGNTWKWAFGILVAVILAVVGYMNHRIDAIELRYTQHVAAEISSDARLVRIEENLTAARLDLSRVEQRIDAIDAHIRPYRPGR